MGFGSDLIGNWGVGGSWGWYLVWIFFVLGLAFLVVTARPLCLRRKIFCSIFMNICWFLFGWGLLGDFLWDFFFSSWVSKSNFGTLMGVEFPGLLFRFGVGILGGLFGVVGLTVLPVIISFAFWLGFLKKFLKNFVVWLDFGVAGSHVPPAISVGGFGNFRCSAWSVGMVGCFLQITGPDWVVRILVAGSLVPPATCLGGFGKIICSAWSVVRVGCFLQITGSDWFVRILVAGSLVPPATWVFGFCCGNCSAWPSFSAGAVPCKMDVKVGTINNVSWKLTHLATALGIVRGCLIVSACWLG